MKSDLKSKIFPDEELSWNKSVVNEVCTLPKSRIPNKVITKVDPKDQDYAFSDNENPGDHYISNHFLHGKKRGRNSTQLQTSNKKVKTDNHKMTTTKTVYGQQTLFIEAPQTLQIAIPTQTRPTYTATLTNPTTIKIRSK